MNAIVIEWVKLTKTTLETANVAIHALSKIFKCAGIDVFSVESIRVLVEQALEEISMLEKQINPPDLRLYKQMEFWE